MNLLQKLGLQEAPTFKPLPNGKVAVTMKSLFSGKINTRELPITMEQVEAWQNGVLIQNAFPHLNADDREFMQTGAVGSEWDDNLGSED